MSETLYCSFCGKSQHDVDVFVAGPASFICGECIELCALILVEQRAQKRLKVEKRIEEKMEDEK